MPSDRKAEQWEWPERPVDQSLWHALTTSRQTLNAGAALGSQCTTTAGALLGWLGWVAVSAANTGSKDRNQGCNRSLLTPGSSSSPLPPPPDALRPMQHCCPAHRTDPGSWEAGSWPLQDWGLLCFLSVLLSLGMPRPSTLERRVL